MPGIFCLVDDKHIPLYRILWVSQVPHFCGHEDCDHEGDYEVRLEMDESIWVNSQQERDHVLRSLEAWQTGQEPGPDAGYSDS